MDTKDQYSLNNLVFKKFRGIYYALKPMGFVKNRKGVAKVWAWVLMDNISPVIANISFFESNYKRLDECIESFKKTLKADFSANFKVTP